jgi:hypothetical protein
MAAGVRQVTELLGGKILGGMLAHSELLPRSPRLPTEFVFLFCFFFA